MEFTGDFETHLTVRCANPAQVEHVRAWCAFRSVKFTHIELSRGDCISQPMLTLRGKGVLSRQHAPAAAWVERLRDAGIPVVRVKIEAAPTNADIPQTAAEAARQPADRHFEQHLKLGLKFPAELETATVIAERFGGHVSRNALRKTGQGSEERFVTQRFYGVGWPVAQAGLRALTAALAEAGLNVLDSEEEFVVYDSNLAIDRGWLAAEEKS